MKLGKKKIFSLALILVLVIALLSGCVQTAPTEETSKEVKNSSIILATTTSTENSGLLDYLLPVFEKDTGIKVKVVAVGTGKALKMGEDGEADVLLVHAKSSEEAFVKAGHGLERFDVMYNDFVIIGPKNDPAKLYENASNDVIKAFKLINKGNAKFVSRGDDSGTHKKEKKFWEEAGIEPKGDWYLSAGKGMGDVIQMANEIEGYTLSDRATYLSMKDKIDLEILVEGDNKLFNQYGVIAVNPNKNEKINNDGAQKFIDWILGEKAQGLIKAFGKDKFSKPLFIPNAR
ncbi:extracellular solute-binding protein [Crassaminicella thermophila]|uniref:Extracellular solute-binding protein n=1 Tax=Crassaminicella thermophila TaxID=2599308 RepID=A0A5C0SAI4_CRATE|nr:substrate-binding domain-containing protein [Crassaminicella thermophila]QEK11565.1 extracellular solute-binding protein [Crassaminicella thermophila]